MPNNTLSIEISKYGKQSFLELGEAIEFYLEKKNKIEDLITQIADLEGQKREFLAHCGSDEIKEGISHFEEIGLSELKSELQEVTDLKELFINGKNIIEFINEARLLLSVNFYYNLDDLQDRLEKENAANKKKFIENDEDEDEDDNLIDNEDSNDVKEAKASPRKDFNLVSLVTKYLKNSKQTYKLDFNIKDQEGYTILGVAALQTGHIFAYDCCEVDANGKLASKISSHSFRYQVFRDLIELANFYDVKLSVELRVVPTATYVNILDLFLSHCILSEIAHPYDRGTEFFQNLDLLLQEREDCLQIVNTLDFININYRDLALASFMHKSIFIGLVNIITSPISDGVEAMELYEIKDAVVNSGNLFYADYLGSTILATFSGSTVKRVYELLLKYQLNYDPTKLNPCTGNYASIGCFPYWPEKMEIFAKMALLLPEPKSFDINHRNDFGGHFLFNLKSDKLREYFFRLAIEKKQVIDFKTNMFGYAFDFKNSRFRSKIAVVSSWYNFWLSDDRNRNCVENLIKDSFCTDYRSREELIKYGIILKKDAVILKNALQGNILLDFSMADIAHQYWELIIHDSYYHDLIAKEQILPFLDLIPNIEIHIHHKDESEQDESEQDESEQELTEEEPKKLAEKSKECFRYITLYQAIFYNAKILNNLSNLFSICQNPKCPTCFKTRSKYDHQLELSLKEIISEEDFKQMTIILSELFARNIKKWRYFIRYAEENDIPINLLAMFDDKTIIELAILNEDQIVLQSILFYAVRNQIIIDFTVQNKYKDTILETSLSNKLKVEMLLDFIESNLELVKVNESNKHDMLRVLERHDELLTCYEGKEDNTSFYFVARIKQDQGKFEEAIEIYDKMIKKDKNAANAYYGKGLSLYQKKEYQDAIKCLNKAISANPHNPLYDITKVQVFLDLGETDNVLQILSMIDMKIATKYINRLFTPIQKDLFNIVTQTTGVLINKKESTANIVEQKQIVDKVIKAFSSGIKINYLQAISFKTELEILQQQIFSTLSRWKKISGTSKSWEFSEQPDEGSKEEYQLISVPPLSKDSYKVAEFYQHHPVPGYDIKSIEIIYNPTMESAFENGLKMLQARHQNPAFVPRFLQEGSEEERLWRKEINQLWEKMSAPHKDPDCPEVKLLPLWHGTRAEILPSIFKAGFANLATTDSGYFGKGLYSTHEAEYAHGCYFKGAMLLNWVSSFSARPVIAGDMKELTGKGNYQNYDTHFVVVTPYTKDNLDNFIPENINQTQDVYLPCFAQQKHKYIEVVVFEKSQCLPRYLVHLQPTLVKSIYSAENDKDPRNHLTTNPRITPN